MNNVKGYKAMNADMTCRNLKFKIGKTYTCDEISMCSSGFHFCENPLDVYNYYPKSSNTIVCEVEASGKILKEGDKSVTDTLKIVKRLTDKELLDLWIKRTNSGYHNSGHCNSGHYNSGHRNSGDRNSGDYNSGYHNSGDHNRGDYNSGYFNSGHYNSGYHNSGHRNSGHYNSGDYNSGYHNSGHYNSGNHNSGHYNSGHHNSGDYNSGHYNSGLFNTDEPTVRLFNKQTRINRNDPCIQAVLNVGPTMTEWVSFSDMTVQEKKNNPKAKVMKGYLKVIPYKKAWLNFWVNATKETRELFLRLPNFDAKIFKKITGIDVKKRY